MDKNIILNKVLKNIIDSNLVNCVFTDDLVRDNSNPYINIYCVTSLEKLSLFFKYQKSFLDDGLNLIHIQVEEDRLSAYYECGLIIKIFVRTDLDFEVYTNIYSLYDPSAFLRTYVVKNYALKNLELAQLIDKFSQSLVNYYNNKLLHDDIESLNLAKTTLDIFTVIYRGFYDSMNAKKQYKELNLSMNNIFLNRLLEIISLNKLNTDFESIKLMINEMDLMVSKLPVNIVSLFNIDFYNYAKDLILSL